MQAILVLYFADSVANEGMGMSAATMTWVGLGLISAGTGLLKPNVATMVGKLYRTDDERRDAGFALARGAMRRAVRLIVSSPSPSPSR